MKQTLAIFSGLPGTGKSTLAERLALEFQWPLHADVELVRGRYHG